MSHAQTEEPHVVYVILRTTQTHSGDGHVCMPHNLQTDTLCNTNRHHPADWLKLVLLV